MVRTKELGHALGHVAGRGVGIGDRDDSNDAPQCQRPTASARRQRVPVTVAHDEPMLPAMEADGASVETKVFPDDPMAPADVEDIGADIPVDIGAQATEELNVDSYNLFILLISIFCIRVKYTFLNIFN